MPLPDNYYAKQPPFTGNTVVEIDIPSGKLIANDSLRSVKHFDVEPPLSINYGFGLDAYAVLLAKQANAAYAFVGNSCPSITRQLDGTFEVVSPEWDDDTDEPVLNAEETVVAEICTDLWATMLTDYQNWLDHGGPDIGTANAGFAIQAFTVFDVPPGKLPMDGLLPHGLLRHSRPGSHDLRPAGVHRNVLRRILLTEPCGAPAERHRVPSSLH